MLVFNIMNAVPVDWRILGDARMSEKSKLYRLQISAYALKTGINDLTANLLSRA